MSFSQEISDSMLVVVKQIRCLNAKNDGCILNQLYDAFETKFVNAYF